jgi:DNA-binding PadR family transcriptional regulator
MLRDFFLGFIRIHVLHHAAKAPVYGLLLIQELRHHGYEVGPGTLYPLLHGLSEAGYLAREDRVIGGRVRKYYAITAAGHEALALARTQIRELVEEVLDDHGPTRLRVRPARRVPGPGAAARGRRAPPMSRTPPTKARR